MSTSLIYHTQSVIGFQVLGCDYHGGGLTARVRQKPGKLLCAACGSPEVSPTFIKHRLVRGLQMGRLWFGLKIAVHRLLGSCGSWLAVGGRPYRTAV